MTKARDIASASPAPSTVSATELGYLDGVTSAIQTQINSKIGQATAINPSIVTAKGDLIVATGSGTVMAQPVGTDGQYLQADSTQADGVKWATVTIPPSVNVYGYKFTSGAGAGPYTVNNTFNTGTWTHTGTNSCNVTIGSNTSSTAISSTVFAASNASSATIDLAPGAVYTIASTTFTNDQASAGQAASNGTNLWLAPMGKGYLLKSTNGTDWSLTSQIAGANGGMPFTAVARRPDNNMFVACTASNYGQVFSSTDGFNTWATRLEPGTNYSFRNVVWGGDRFVTIMYGWNEMRSAWSTDGTNWNSYPLIAAGGQYCEALAYGNGLFITFGFNGSRPYFTSPDGNTWTSRTSPFPAGYYCNNLVYGDKFVAIATDGTNVVACTSTNGTSWTSPVALTAFVSGTMTSHTLVYNPNAVYKYAIRLNQFGGLLMSTDGITWVVRGSTRFNTIGTTTTQFETFFFAGGRYISMGVDSNNTRRVATSTDPAGTLSSDIYVSLIGPSTFTTTVV